MTWSDRIFFIVLIAVAVLIDLRCRKSAADSAHGGDTLSTTITYKRDSTIYSHHEDTHTIHKIDSIYMQVPVGMDSVTMRRLVEQYLSQNIFSNVIEDTLLKATITDTVSRNAILGRRFDYMIKRPQTVITTVVVAPRDPHLFLEGFTGLNTDKVTQLSLKLDYVNKKNQMLTGGWDFKNKAVIFGVGIRVW